MVMTGTEAAVAAQFDTARARRKDEKELKTKRKDEAQLAALHEKSLSPPLRRSRLPRPD